MFLFTDELVLEDDAPRISKILKRISLIARLAAGMQQRIQPTAANLDTLFIVTSCNEDFNLSRLERYLAVALDARVEPEASSLLAPWLGAGQSVAFVGSSAVGKSTLVNTLSGSASITTGHIREGATHAIVRSPCDGRWMSPYRDCQTCREYRT